MRLDIGLVIALLACLGALAMLGGMAQALYRFRKELVGRLAKESKQ